MKRYYLPLCVLIGLIPPVLTAPPATAQFSGVVYDPANHTQNILQAVRSLQEVRNQIQQLTHEIEMLENMAKDLQGLPDSIAEDIANRIRRIEDLTRRAEGIGYGVEEIEREYEEIYPDHEQASSEPQILVDAARARWQQSRSAYKQSLIVSAGVVENLRQSQTTLNDLITHSQSAEGNLAALQAGNQIDALTAEQLMQMESMMAAHYRAEALERARELAEAERGRARLKSFLGN